MHWHAWKRCSVHSGGLGRQGLDRDADVQRLGTATLANATDWRGGLIIATDRQADVAPVGKALVRHVDAAPSMRFGILADVDPGVAGEIFLANSMEIPADVARWNSQRAAAR